MSHHLRRVTDGTQEGQKLLPARFSGESRHDDRKGKGKGSVMIGATKRERSFAAMVATLNFKIIFARLEFSRFLEFSSHKASASYLIKTL
jgi:hypothetical protein